MELPGEIIRGRGRKGSQCSYLAIFALVSQVICMNIVDVVMFASSQCHIITTSSYKFRAAIPGTSSAIGVWCTIFPG